jgi:pyruvate/2-oxoglutarate/acetoin dehydrogenase E1 component
VIELGVAAIARSGGDLTIASAGKGVADALVAAEALQKDGVDAEVVDLRTLRPLDTGCVLESVARTNRLVVVEEGPRTGGWAAGLLGAVAEAGLHDLDDAWILPTGETPVPYAPTLEDAFIPGPEAIAASVRERSGSPASPASAIARA